MNNVRQRAPRSPTQLPPAVVSPIAGNQNALSAQPHVELQAFLLPGPQLVLPDSALLTKKVTHPPSGTGYRSKLASSSANMFHEKDDTTAALAGDKLASSEAKSKGRALQRNTWLAFGKELR